MARTGQQFIDGLRDGREVWLNGRRVKDVTEEPALRPAIDAVANLYDLQHDPALKDTLTVESAEVGCRIGRTYQLPRTSDDLVKRRQTITAWMERSAGFLGRSPDFMNTMIAAMRAKSSFFAQQSIERQEALESYYKHAATSDVFLTHSLHEPQLDRTKRRSEQPDPDMPLHVVEETSRGLIVSGAKLVATASPFADDILLWPTVPNFGPGDEPYALACCIPVSSPGIKLVCRPSFIRSGTDQDFPLSSRFDEMDAAVFFDRVLVPWDRVFLHGDTNLIREMYAKTRIRELTAHQTAVRLLVKLEFIYALMVRLSEVVGREKSSTTNVSLGDAVTSIEIIRSCIVASEALATVDPENGVLYPDFASLMVSRIMGPRIYPEFLNKIRVIGSSALMQIPSTSRDFAGPIATFLNKYTRSMNASAQDRAALLRYAWDVCGGDFGSRHGLYELFYGGDPDRNLERLQQEYPHKQRQLASFDAFLASMQPKIQAGVPPKIVSKAGA